jgi:hypothetical protein
MRLVFVHGMRQEDNAATDLLKAWRESLHGAWDHLGLNQPDIEPEMPYYGDVLDQLTRESQAGDNTVGRGAFDHPLPSTQEAMMREFADIYDIEDTEIRGELGSEIVARGPANWEFIQGMGRVLERRIPLFRKIGISLIVQVDGYLNRPHIRQRVDGIVAPYLGRGPAVIVSHSLGTIVSYRLLRQTKSPHVSLFVTLGSPLGINAVKDCIRPPKLAIPVRVTRWLNGADNRDFVALYKSLDTDTFCGGIENINDIHNRNDDAHSVIDYLADTRIATAIHQALTS